MTDNVFAGLNKEDLLAPEIKIIPSEFYEFYSLRLAAHRKITLFSKNSGITIPEIQIKGQAFTTKKRAIKEGGNNEAYFLEVIGYKKEKEEEYKFVEILTVNPDIELTQAQIDFFPPFYKTEEQIKLLKEHGKTKFSLFKNFYSEQFAAQDDMNELGAGKQFHAKVRVIQYHTEPKMIQDTDEQDIDNKGNPALWRDNYYTNWERFDTVEELLAAKRDHWNNDNDNSSLPSFQYPEKWHDENEAMIQWFKDQLEKPDADRQALAIKASLTSEFTPDWKAILIKDIGIPEPLIDW